MAHRSHEPARLQSRKKRLPRDRGEKYVAPDMSVDEEPAAAAPGARARRGNAHDLILAAPPGSLSYPVLGDREGTFVPQAPRRRASFPLLFRLLGGLGGVLALAGAVRLYRRR